MDGAIRITARNLDFYRAVLTDDSDRRALMPGAQIRVGAPLFNKIFDGLVAAGDAFVARVMAHGYPDGSLSEQINRHTGFMKSAHDLTWSYASVLTALWNRPDVLAARRQPASRLPGSGSRE
jgi:glucoamylase